MTFTLNIKCDNAAFDPPDRDAEIARILRDVASRVERWNQYGGVISDVNGNIVGKYNLKGRR